jgi:mono/diheme cytochrome c family protein
MRSGLAFAVLAVGGLAACTALDGLTPVTGRALYADYCAACHGTAGRGDGPAAAGLSARPADLSVLARDNGGTYPQVRVMSKVYGYSEGRGGGGGTMPEFGPMLEGRTVLVETEPGIFTPTPEKLALLAEYVGTLQRE